jgi:hypothetical protein
VLGVQTEGAAHASAQAVATVTQVAPPASTKASGKPAPKSAPAVSVYVVTPPTPPAVVHGTASNTQGAAVATAPSFFPPWFWEWILIVAVSAVVVFGVVWKFF